MSGWDTLNQAIQDVRALILAEAPDDSIAGEGEAYITRVVTAALSAAVLGHHLREGGLTRALPVYGGPNPDYIMRSAGLDPSRTYRIEGQLNGSERVGIGVYRIGPNGAPMIAGYAAFDSRNCGPDGAFTLDISPDASASGGISMPGDARILLCRTLHRDDHAAPARYHLIGADDARGPTLMTGSNDGALTFVAQGLRANVQEYLKWMHAARDLPNQLDTAPLALAETVVGDADTQYFLGGFALDAGQWLEVALPPCDAPYWSLHAYNFWYEHLQSPGVHDRNAVADSDGWVRIAVGPTRPANARNWIDTVGRHKGAFVCRIVGASSAMDSPQTHVHTLA